jgi:hypothetical protein
MQAVATGGCEVLSTEKQVRWILSTSLPHDHEHEDNWVHPAFQEH